MHMPLRYRLGTLHRTRRVKYSIKIQNIGNALISVLIIHTDIVSLWRMYYVFCLNVTVLTRYVWTQTCRFLDEVCTHIIKMRVVD